MSIVTVCVGCCVPIPSAFVARNPALPANASATASNQKRLAKLAILPTRYLDPFVDGPVDLIDPFLTVGVGVPLLPADVPGGA